MSDLKAYNAKNLTARMLMAVSVLLVLFGSWSAIKWQFGDMLATLTKPGDANASHIAELAIKWAPADPAAQRLKGATGDDSSVSLRNLEQTVKISPNDYRWRIDLARAYEQDDQIESAEREFKAAVDLAPSYAVTHWHLGNFYFRQTRNNEAMSELTAAAENNQSYRDQVFSLAWDYFGKDPEKLEQLASGRPDSLAYLAFFFAARGRDEDSVRTWKKLTDADKPRFAGIAKVIAEGLYGQHRYPASLAFTQEIGFAGTVKPETVTNPSFEKNFGEAEESRFDWQILRNDPKIDVGIDSKVKHLGNRSIRIAFKNFSKPSFTNVAQNIVVQTNTKYRLTFWLMTDSLRSAGLPLIEVFNPADDKVLGRSQPFPSGTNDWQQISIEFITPENSDGITVRTNRNGCGDDCQLTGTVWYDDFDLARK